MQIPIFSKLKLTQKGLILVCLPVGVMLGFLVTLLLIMQKVEVQLNAVARSKEFLSAAGSFSKLYYDLGMEVLILDYTKSTRTKERVEAMRKLVPLQLQKLKDLAASDAKEQEMINGLEQLNRKISFRISRYEQYLEDKESSPLIEFSNLYSEIRSLCNEFADRIHTLNAYESSKYIQKAAAEAQTRGILKSWILFGVILNIAMGVLLVVSFNRITARRLGLLMDNTLRLAQHAPLNAPLTGNDEIAQLDRFFHSMAVALEAAAKKERAIVENAVDVICSIGNRGRFTAVNPACESVWGYKPDELIGCSYATILHPEDYVLFANALTETRRDNNTQVLETRVVHKNQNTVFIRWSLRWAAGEQSTFCVAHDITERKEIERVKEEFLTMVSHDLRTPLTSLEALLTLVLEGNYGQLSEQGKRRVAGAEQDINRLIKMINDLLDIEMLESGHLTLSTQKVDIDSVINRSLEAVRGFADQKGIKLQSKPLHATVYGDPERLVQVCVNFLSNAIKFSSAPASVNVITKELDDWVEVQVKDEGPGIPTGYDAIVFERYKRVQGSDGERIQGTGLGLAICKTIIKQHGGEIGVESTPEEGSTFWFRVPTLARSASQNESVATNQDAEIPA